MAGSILRPTLNYRRDGRRQTEQELLLQRPGTACTRFRGLYQIEPGKAHVRRTF